MKNYIIIEGLDGSGSSYNYEKLIASEKFSILSKELYIRDKRYNDNSNWWELEPNEIQKRLEFYAERNIKQNQSITELIKENHVIQLKGFVTTLIVHSYFLKKNIDQLLMELDLLNLKDFVKANVIFAIYAPSKLRNERFEERKNKGELTKFDIITLSEEYEDFWLNCIKELNKSKIFGEIVLLDNSDTNVYERRIKNEIFKLTKLSVE